MNVAVIGLGKLGLPMAAVFANAGHSVIGLDLDERVVAALNRGEVLIDEPGLADMVTANAERIRATTSFAEAVAESEMSFVIVPTPSGADGTFINDYAVAALEAIGSALRAAPRGHLVAVTSTVMPDATRTVLAPAFETALGRPLGGDVHLCYSPEFIALGSVVRDLTHPDLILIGAADRDAGERLASFYHSISGDAVPARVMSWANAELAKIAINTFVTTKISFANMLAAICEELPDGDVDAVTSAIGLDSRIGTKYLKGGPPYGGPCFPRDNRALSVFAESLGARADLAKATDALNDATAERIADRIMSGVAPGSTVAVLGIAYKDHTPVIEESPGVKIIAALEARGAAVVAHDRRATLQGAPGIATARQVPTVSDAVAAADAIVLATDAKEYAMLDLSTLRAGARVFDLWRLLSDTDSPADVIALGRYRSDTTRG